MFVLPEQFAPRRFARELAVPLKSVRDTEAAKSIVPLTELAQRELAIENVELPSFAKSSENAEPSAAVTPCCAPRESAPENAKPKVFAENTTDVTRSAETKLFAETPARPEESANITENVERLVTESSVAQNYIAKLSVLLERSAVTTRSVL
jgi:hypothetical protein